MKPNKQEVNNLIDALGNEKKTIASTPDFMEWMNATNPLSDVKPTERKKGCKSGNCGNNKKTFIIIGVILFIVMWAGYGIFSFIANLL